MATLKIVDIFEFVVFLALLTSYYWAESSVLGFKNWFLMLYWDLVDYTGLAELSSKVD